MSRLLGIAFKADEVLQFEGFASKLGIPFDVILLEGQYEGGSSAEKILRANLSSPTADSIDGGLSALLSPYSHVAAVSSMASKDLLPRLAAKTDGAMVTDVVDVLGSNEFLRPLVAGSVLGVYQTSASPIILTFRPAGFLSHSPSNTPPSESVQIPVTSGSTVISASGGSGARPDLTQAKVVVSGGRPLKDADTFEKVIGGFADAFGGAVGATRAAVDAGIAPNEAQVGQTGKIVAPDLYVAAGISGSTQHMAGIKDSKLIVAVNKDPDAPIFAAADLGIVGDLFEVLPALQQALKKS